MWEQCPYLCGDSRPRPSQRSEVSLREPSCPSWFPLLKLFRRRVPISRALFAREVGIFVWRTNQPTVTESLSPPPRTSDTVPDPSRLAGILTRGFGDSMILVPRKKRRDLLRKF